MKYVDDELDKIAWMATFRRDPTGEPKFHKAYALHWDMKIWKKDKKEPENEAEDKGKEKKDDEENGDDQDQDK